MATETSAMAVIRASRPSFRNPHDKVAFALHASFLAAGFSLIATGKNAFSDNPPTEGDEVGIEDWNELDDCYGFLYTKTLNGSKKAVLVKCLVAGNILVVDVLNLMDQQKEPYNLQIDVDQYSAEGVGGPGNYGEMYKNLQGLVENLNEGILSKLEPKTGKSSFAAETSSSNHGAERSERSTTSEPGHQPCPPGLVYPAIPPFVGSDVYPGPGAGFFPQRGPGFDAPMIVGPNDPRWFGMGPNPGFPGRIPGVPPGGRFDPYGPPDVPGFEPGRFVRQPRRPPRGGVHPDLEHFQGPDYI